MHNTFALTHNPPKSNLHMWKHWS